MNVQPVAKDVSQTVPTKPEHLEIDMLQNPVSVIFKPEEAPRHSELLNTIKELSTKEAASEFMQMMNYLGGGAF